jgi:hypothetical protein
MKDVDEDECHLFGEGEEEKEANKEESYLQD